MKSWTDIAILLAFVIAIGLVANAILQRFLPTRYSDSYERKLVYSLLIRFVWAAVALVACVLLALASGTRIY